MLRDPLLLLLLCLPTFAAGPKTLQISAADLEDKVRGGLIGQIYGDLNGLKHEMKYIEEPGNVTEYTPALPDGAWTDDDTDIEWIYILKIQSSKEILLSPSVITEEWKQHINRRFWCSHRYLRQLMDLGLLPPHTGNIVFNPWADFNLSGQFVSETWGLISPGMPQTAARIAAHYLRVSVDLEPVQASQLFSSMIATAYVTPEIDKILDAGYASLDPKSVMRKVVSDVRAWHKQNPADWRATRKLIKDNYTYYGGKDERDRNGVIANGAATVAALLYGKGDFVETVRHAFNFGWDADNNAATSATIIGVTKGAKWFAQQGWAIKDVFRNTSRDNMPADETITRMGDRLVAITAQVIAEHGGRKDGETFHIRTEAPANVTPLGAAVQSKADLKKHYMPDIERALKSPGDKQALARAAYVAICVDEAPALKAKYAEGWKAALAALQSYPKVLQVMFHQSPIPNGESLRQRALAAGVTKPEKDTNW